MPQLLARADETPPMRTKAQIEAQLLAYCRLDTLAMVKVWATLAGRKDVLRIKDDAESK